MHILIVSRLIPIPADVPRRYPLRIGVKTPLYDLLHIFQTGKSIWVLLSLPYVCRLMVL